MEGLHQIHSGRQRAADFLRATDWRDGVHVCCGDVVENSQNSFYLSSYFYQVQVMKIQFVKNIVLCVVIFSVVLTACSTSQPIQPQPPASMPQNGFPDKPALPNDSGIEGVQTFPDKSIYHNHVQAVTDPKTEVPLVFGEHLPVWENCG